MWQLSNADNYLKKDNVSKMLGVQIGTEIYTSSIRLNSSYNKYALVYIFSGSEYYAVLDILRGILEIFDVIKKPLKQKYTIDGVDSPYVRGTYFESSGEVVLMEKKLGRWRRVDI